MKLIILEGQDNLGKTSIIREICKDYKSFIVRKFSNPPNYLNLFEKEKYQKHNFLKEFRFYAMIKNSGIFEPENSIMIWDRSHIGEQVYGPLYRKNNPTQWLKELEEIFNLNDAYLILLEGHHDFVIQNEDGKSLSMSEERYKEFLKEFNSDSTKLNSKIQAINLEPDLNLNQKIKKTEAILFEYGFENSTIKKKLKIKVDYSDEIKIANLSIARDLTWHGIDIFGFRSSKDIIQEVNQFINDKKE